MSFGTRIFLSLPWILITEAPRHTHTRRCRTNHTHSSAQAHTPLHNQNRAEPPCQTNYWNINGSDGGKIGPIWIGNGWMILIGISTQNRTFREPPSFSPTERLLLKKIHKTSHIISCFLIVAFIFTNGRFYFSCPS